MTLRITAGDFAFGGELETERAPKTVAAFERLYRRRGGRGRQMQRLGPLGQMLALGHGDEDPQLIERHFRKIERNRLIMRME